ANLALSQIRVFDIQPRDRVLQFASLSFDASVFETWCTLLAGATLYLAPREALMPGPTLVQFLVEQGITMTLLPPSALEVMPDHPLPALRTLVVGGEACPPHVVGRWAPGRRFFNAYGPTEATVCASVGACVPGGRVTIGRPLDNVCTYLLD